MPHLFAGFVLVLKTFETLEIEENFPQGLEKL